jgi:hypothetical protein
VILEMLEYALDMVGLQRASDALSFLAGAIMKCLMNSWLRPLKSPASATFPERPSKTYSFSTSTQGNARRSALSWSRNLVDAVSLASNAMPRPEPFVARYDVALHVLPPCAARCAAADRDDHRGEQTCRPVVAECRAATPPSP